MGDTAGNIRMRFRQELARLDIPSEAEAARRIGRPQQWLNARLHGLTPWKVEELEDACQKLGMSYVFVATGLNAFVPSGGGRSTEWNEPNEPPAVPAVRRRHVGPDPNASPL